MTEKPKETQKSVDSISKCIFFKMLIRKGETCICQRLNKQSYCLLTLLRNIFIWLISMISNYKASKKKNKTVPQYTEFTNIGGSDQEAIKRLNFYCYPICHYVNKKLPRWEHTCFNMKTIRKSHYTFELRYAFHFYTMKKHFKVP